MGLKSARYRAYTRPVKADHRLRGAPKGAPLPHPPPPPERPTAPPPPCPAQPPVRSPPVSHGPPRLGTATRGTAVEALVASPVAHHEGSAIGAAGCVCLRAEGDGGLPHTSTGGRTRHEADRMARRRRY